MIVAAVLLFAAWIISSNWMRRALPFESLVAVGTAGLVMMVLLYSGQFG